DARGRVAAAPPPLPRDAAALWQDRLARDTPPDSHTSLVMLEDFGIAVTRSEVIRSAEEAVAAWTRIGGPVALKTVAPGIAHRSAVGGVHLGLNERAAVQAAWADLCERFGPAVEVSEMQPAGVEMLLGMTTDPDIGPIVAIGFGGIHAELRADLAFALPPFDAAHARRLIERLRLRPLLDGDRGSGPADVDALCDAVARFSVMAAALAGRIREIDVNPLIVHSGGCVAVDALTVPHTTEQISERQVL
ncbi:MAG: acetate--CoA ligase family protein, partial [Gammaproteobacteria bacterium]